MKKVKNISVILLVLALLIIGSSSIVVTNENEYSLIRQFGKVDHVVSSAGVTFKIPFVQSVDKLPKEILLYDLSSSDVITSDKKTMICDSYILWQINDPLKFAQTLNSSISNAESRLDTIVYNSTKNIISSTTQNDVISGRDGELAAAIMKNIGNTTEQYGIELLSFETKQLDLPSDNKAAVYERMISERENISATYTAEGSSEAQKIRNTTDKEVNVLLSEANKNAEILIAEGEAEYMRILSEAYSDESKQDFYSFVRSLDALKASMTGDNKTVILSPDSETEEKVQKNMIRDLLKTDIQALAVSPIDSYECEEYVQQAKEKGISVYACDTPIEDADVPYIGIDNEKLGYELGEQLARALDHKGKIGVIAGDFNQAGHWMRVNGFEKYMEKEPGITIEMVRNGYSNMQVSQKDVDEILKKYPDLDGIMTTSAVTALGLAEATEGREISIVSVDAQEDALKAVQDGRIVALGAQSGYQIGYETIRYIVNDLEGKRTGEDEILDSQVLTTENIDAYIKEDKYSSS